MLPHVHSYLMNYINVFSNPIRFVNIELKRPRQDIYPTNRLPGWVIHVFMITTMALNAKQICAC